MVQAFKLPAAVAAVALMSACSRPGLPNRDPHDEYVAPADVRQVAPDCEAIWVANELLPADYVGCNDGRTFYGVPLGRGGCNLATYETDAGDYYAIPGTTIIQVDELFDDPGFAAAVEACAE